MSTRLSEDRTTTEAPARPETVPGPLRAVVVSCRGMGASHARTIASLPERFELAAGCDLNEDVLREFSERFPGVATYTDFSRALDELKPDVVVVATGNTSHASLTIQAAESGSVRGVYCEKPMAVTYGDARRMVETCRRHNVALAINHQRRMLPAYRKMRQLMEDGAIGTVEQIICHNAGDVLSDGTHFVDVARHLAGDAEVKWVLGSLYRSPPNPDEPRAMGFQTSGGWRYGHPVETGGVAVLQFANNIRATMYTGEMIWKHKGYQHYEVLGSKGRLLRAGDQSNPPVMIQDEQGGLRAVEVEAPAGTHPQVATMQEIFTWFADAIHTGREDHPLRGESALKDQEIVMAIYESARLRQRLDLPLNQDRFPLEIMIEEGWM